MKRHEAIVLLVLWTVLALISLLSGPPHGYVIWLLEVAPILLALLVLIPTYRRFRFTPFAYRLIFLHALVLTMGAHYTYSEVPFGNWLQESFGLDRNPYDRVGRLAQGFFPAIVAREVLLRTSPLQRGKWLFFIVTCVLLAFSALYELIEWWVAVLMQGDDLSQDFLGTQGDVWDAQWDMFLCLWGAIFGQLLLARFHNRQLDILEDDE